MTDLARLDALFADWQGGNPAAYKTLSIELHNAYPALREQLREMGNIADAMEYWSKRAREAEDRLAAVSAERDAYWPFVEMIAESRHPSVKDYFDAKEMQRERHVAARAASEGKGANGG